MQDIFISYRRDDASDVTGRIADVLKSKFGANLVFKDVDSIPLGTDFRHVISEAVGRCDVLLAVIGDDWLQATNETGTRRIDDPDDFVHIEIRAALERDIPVIPVLVEGAKMARDRDLPKRLQSLAFRNAIAVRPDPDFHNDMERLCRALSDVVRKSAKLPQGRLWVAVVAGVIVMLALGAAFYFLAPAKRLEPVAPTRPDAAVREASRPGQDERVRPLPTPGENRPQTEPQKMSSSGPEDVFVLAAVIDDPDGYTNVRSMRSASSQIVARVDQGERFYTYAQDGNWWQVKTAKGKVGYMHVSKFRVLSSSRE
ncbi:MAG TPA: TIR domain-containing protein [Terrimicrobiaceae bacterium]